MEYNNHLKVGFTKIEHKGKTIVTSINSSDFEKFVQNLDSYDYDVGNIPPGFEHRADLISELFYNTPTLDWLICWFNDIKDPFQQLNVFDIIKIPRIV